MTPTNTWVWCDFVWLIPKTDFGPEFQLTTGPQHPPSRGSGPARDVLSNMLSCLVIYLTQPFAQGDWITLEQGQDGWAEEIGLFYTCPAGEGLGKGWRLECGVLCLERPIGGQI